MNQKFYIPQEMKLREIPKRITKGGIYRGEVVDMSDNEDSFTVHIKPSNENGIYDEVTMELPYKYRPNSIADKFLRNVKLSDYPIFIEILGKCLGRIINFEVRRFREGNREFWGIVDLWDIDGIVRFKGEKIPTLSCKRKKNFYRNRTRSRRV